MPRWGSLEVKYFFLFLPKRSKTSFAQFCPPFSAKRKQLSSFWQAATSVVRGLGFGREGAFSTEAGGADRCMLVPQGVLRRDLRLYQDFVDGR